MLKYGFRWGEPPTFKLKGSGNLGTEPSSFLIVLVAVRLSRPASPIRILIRRAQHLEPRTVLRQSARARKITCVYLVHLHVFQHHRLPRAYPATRLALGRVCRRAAALALSRRSIIISPFSGSPRRNRATTSSRLCRGDRPHRLTASSTSCAAHTCCHTWARDRGCSTPASTSRKLRAPDAACLGPAAGRE